MSTMEDLHGHLHRFLMATSKENTCPRRRVQFGLSDGGWDMGAAYHDYLDRLARRITTDGSGL